MKKGGCIDKCFYAFIVQEKMKLVLLGPVNNIHIQKFIEDLAEEYEVHVISLKNHKIESGEDNLKAKIHYLPIGGKKGYIFNAYFLLKKIKEIKPNLINVHYATGYGALGTFIKKRKKILSVWGSDIYLYPNKNLLNKFILKKILNEYKYLMSTSVCMANETKKYLQNSKEIFITPFGVDILKFKNIKQENKSNKFRIGLVKALEKKYGIDSLIKAILEIRNSNIEIYEDIEVEIYGKGKLKESLETMILKNKLEKKIVLKGFVKNSEVPKVLNSFSLVCIPSKSESFGVSAIEAMACEIPVIVSSADGLKEVVEDGRLGEIFEINNYKQLAELICKNYYKKKNKESSSLKQIRELIKERYSREVTKQKILKAYLKVINS